MWRRTRCWQPSQTFERMASGSVSVEPNSQIFTLLLFSWNLITDYERKELLYADHEDPFMSLFSKEKFDEMDQFLVAKVATSWIMVST